MIAPCNRCGAEGADYIFPRWCICPCCDEPVTPAAPKSNWVMDLFDYLDDCDWADITLDLDDPDTAPGWGAHRPAVCTHMGSYVSRDQHGQLNRWCSDCGGFLGRVP